MSSTSSSHLSDSGFVGQMIAGAGALLALLGVFGVAVAAAGVGLIILGVVISAPSARIPGPFIDEWWTALAIAALLCLAGFALGFLATAPGGLLLAAGGAVTLVVVALGSPAIAPKDEENPG